MFECRTFISVKEICQVLSVSESKSYAIVRDLNKELSDKGYMVIPGRVSRKYFEERFYGVDSFEKENEELSEEYRSDRFYLEECQVGAPLADGSLEEDDFDEDLEEADEMVCASVINSIEVEPAGSLDDALKSIYTESFEKYLQKLINKKGLKKSQVYAAANISKQYFSKLLKGQVKPSKEKVLALAIGLTLNLDEAVDFLRIAGYALSPISQTDTIVECFIRNKDYNVLKIDIVLFDYGLEPLSNA